ncbi:MAG TPA: DnaJ family domain-containing protein [Acidimicrobiia bacterium]|jgi:hypothetical protein
MLSDQSGETLPDRLIREAIEGGELDDLPGHGKPLPGAGQPDDDLWWVKAWLSRSAPDDMKRRIITERTAG